MNRDPRRAVTIVNRLLVAIGCTVGLVVGVLRETVIGGLVTAGVVTFVAGAILFLMIVIGLAISDLVRLLFRLERGLRWLLRRLFGDAPTAGPLPAAVARPRPTPRP